MFEEEIRPTFQSTEQFIDKVEEAEKVCEMVEIQLAKAKDGNTSSRLPLFQFTVDLRQLINLKWEKLCTNILQNIKTLPSEGEDNFKITIQAEGYKVGLWANSTKNPRLGMINNPLISIHRIDLKRSTFPI